MLITLAYIINILVAGGFGILLLMNSSLRIRKVFGEDTAARQILGSVYISIAFFSFIGLTVEVYFFKIASVLFPIQIFYKVLSLFTVRDKSNPVPYSNFVISVFLLLAMLEVV